MPEYRLHLYDTSGHQLSRSLPLHADDDTVAVVKAEGRGARDVYRAVLRDGDRVVAEWPNEQSAA
jgi:hypothetical protein